MRIFAWHVHGSWMTSFVQGDHDYLVPVLPDRGPDGRGRAHTYPWPDRVEEVAPLDAHDADVDVVVLQRPHELGLAERWLGRRPGRDVPAVYVEHNTPQGLVNEMRHPLADRSDITLVHVTDFNDLFWDAGRAPTTVISHGVVEPDARYTGALARASVVVNEPARRRRVVGADLLSRFARVAGVDVFGMGTEAFGGSDLSQAEMHAAIAARRVYVHPFRWTSLGLSLIEAMQIGIPVVALGTTEVREALPPAYPYVSTRVDTCVDAVRHLVADAEEAAAVGKACRQWALDRFALTRFLEEWDALLAEVSR